MLKRIISVAIVITIILGTCSCGSEEPKRYEAQFLNLFDTVTTIVAYSQDEEKLAEQVQWIYDELEIYHQLFDIYNEYPGVKNIKTINDHAGIAPVKVDQKLIDLLIFSKEMHGLTHGKVNVAFGSVLSIWHNYREQGIENPDLSRLPSRLELEEAALHTDIEKVIIDTARSTLYLEDEKMLIDVGAVGKGYALEQVAKKAEEQGITNMLISLGGNVCALGGKYGDDTPWNVGVENPDKESETGTIATVYLLDQSIVSSGDYQRYYTVGGKKYHHIIDPDTLMPTAYYKSVSIICNSSGIADALSTAIFNMPLEEGMKFIESLPQTEACFILKDNQVVYSSGFFARYVP